MNNDILIMNEDMRADEGSGISTEDMDRILRPFFSRRKNGGAGTGLGLSCCMAQVTRVGGKLVVHSKLGIGSTFSVILPKWMDELSAGRAA